MGFTLYDGESKDAMVFHVEPIEFLKSGDQVPQALKELGVKYVPIRASELLKLCGGNVAGCIVCPLQPKHTRATDFQFQLKMKNSPLPVIFYSVRASTDTIVQLMKNGATSFFTLPADPVEIRTAVTEALEENARRLKQKQQMQILQERFRDLTEDEVEVLVGLTAGDSNKRIASRLGVHVRTVESRKLRLLRKTRSKSAPEMLVAFHEFREQQE